MKPVLLLSCRPEDAAAMQERERLRGQSVGVSLTGGNVDAAVLASVLQKT